MDDSTIIWHSYRATRYSLFPHKICDYWVKSLLRPISIFIRFTQIYSSLWNKKRSWYEYLLLQVLMHQLTICALVKANKAKIYQTGKEQHTNRHWIYRCHTHLSVFSNQQILGYSSWHIKLKCIVYKIEIFIYPKCYNWSKTGMKNLKFSFKTEVHYFIFFKIYLSRAIH